MDTFIEKDCILEHEGRKFESGGAVVTDDYLIAYPGAMGQLYDWHNNVIGTYQIISKRKAVFFGHWSWQGSWFYFMRATVNGRKYALRGFGEGMIAKGKALKGKV